MIAKVLTKSALSYQPNIIYVQIERRQLFVKRGGPLSITQTFVDNTVRIFLSQQDVIFSHIGCQIVQLIVLSCIFITASVH